MRLEYLKDSLWWYFGLKRQFQGEDGSLSRPVAVRRQRAAHLPSNHEGTVQSEPVPVGSSCKSARKEATEIFAGNSHPVVHYLNSDPVVSLPADAEPDLFARAARLVAGVFGIADEIDQGLQDLVFIDDKNGVFLILPQHLHVMAG